MSKNRKKSTCSNRPDVNEQIYNALINSGLKVNRSTFNRNNRNNRNSKNMSTSRFSNNPNDPANLYGININSLVSCDAACQEEKRKKELLYMKYVDAEENVRNAPNKLDNAEKEYYLSVYGQAEYNNILMNRYKKEINTKNSNEMNSFNDKKKNILLLLENYNKNISLNNKLDELIKTTLDENNDLIEKIDKINTNINTNERRVYYDDKQVEKISFFKKIVTYILLIIYIIFFIILIFSKKELLNIKIVILFTILLIIPLFFIPILTRIILIVYNWINNSDTNISLSSFLLDIYDEFKLIFGALLSPIDFLA